MLVHSQLELLFPILACNPHKDCVHDVDRSHLELLFSIFAWNLPGSNPAAWQFPSFIAPDMTPVLQVTDTHQAAYFKAACRRTKDELYHLKRKEASAQGVKPQFEISSEEILGVLLWIFLCYAVVFCTTPNTYSVITRYRFVLQM